MTSKVARIVTVTVDLGDGTDPLTVKIPLADTRMPLKWVMREAAEAIHYHMKYEVDGGE